jgi:hypothetical protein
MLSLQARSLRAFACVLSMAVNKRAARLHCLGGSSFYIIQLSLSDGNLHCLLANVYDIDAANNFQSYF